MALVIPPQINGELLGPKIIMTLLKPSPIRVHGVNISVLSVSPYLIKQKLSIWSG